ncbi:MAG: hypothetical protein VKP62_00475 [Candidatus Sericytochromatia bacterium]|nr:hypothetical protein [Candidatus Sericytochromatia bacterium]
MIPDDWSLSRARPAPPSPKHPPEMGSGSHGRPQQPADSRGQDAYRRPVRKAGDVPLWMIAMSADRATGRQYQSDAQRLRNQLREEAWITRWVAAVETPLPLPEATHPMPHRQMAWQACVDRLCRAAGFSLVPPGVVWQPGMTIHRGQYLFQADGSLVQLRPDAAGDATDWLCTVAHETFHHAQHSLLVTRYKGHPQLEDEYDQLADYYRDARNIYRAPGPACPPDVHRRQAMEVGAWRFGQAIAAKHTQSE